MTSKEYLRQAFRLDQIINSDIEEAARLREMTETLSSPVLCERIQTAHSGNAPFVSSLEKIMLLEEKINKEIDTLVDLKEQMRGVIAAVSDPNERLPDLAPRPLHDVARDREGDERRLPYHPPMAQQRPASRGGAG